ncbi:hypothetical protein L484_008691 [Morus notabilis]|uniref:Uncharacterized protein n=1 Tax=Morus notabilis TaxID=981085 RepID=W9R0K5_9ROSA|nr:hypothetical protein L484_008691 [Morus notabilis]
MNLESNSTVVDIDSLTSPVDGSEEASNSSGHMVSAVLSRQIITENSTTHHNESSSSTSTDHHDEKKKVIFLCDGGEYSSTNHNSSSSSVNRGGATPRHAMTYNSGQSNSPRDQIRQNHNPSSNLDAFMKFLREHELSKNLTQVAIAVVASLYGTSEAIHPNMRMALVLLLSVGLQCFWCGTLRRNMRAELLGQVLIIAAFHLLLVNLMLPSPLASIPVLTFIAFLITLGVHFRNELWSG